MNRNSNQMYRLPILRNNSFVNNGFKPIMPNSSPFGNAGMQVKKETTIVAPFFVFFKVLLICCFVLYIFYWIVQQPAALSRNNMPRFVLQFYKHIHS